MTGVESIEIKIVRLPHAQGLQLPDYATAAAAGADLLAAIDWCYEQGWTDGLPVVPPVVPRVDAMLKMLGLKTGSPKKTPTPKPPAPGPPTEGEKVEAPPAAKSKNPAVRTSLGIEGLDDEWSDDASDAGAASS